MIAMQQYHLRIFNFNLFDLEFEVRTCFAIFTELLAQDISV